MEAFNYRANQLHCEQVPLRRLVEKHGTPLYVYSAGHIREQYRAYDQAFDGLDHMICSAIKANSNLAVIRLLAREGSGFDLVSGGDLYRVLRAGGKPQRCVFAGVGKTDDEISYALEHGIYAFHVESEPELAAIDRVARRRKQQAPIAIRVNPGVDPHTHRYISTGKHESKFGISIHRAAAVYRQAARLKGIEIRGVQMHIGSQITSTGPFVTAVKKMLPLVETVREMAGTNLKYFDIGGGLGIRYDNEKPPAPSALARVVRPQVNRLGLRLLLEPGRSILGNSGALLTRVLYVKKTPVKEFVIVDGAMTELIRPALYSSYHEIVPLRRTRRKKVKVDVVGPVCESGDFLAENRRLVSVKPGEYLATLSAGAYGMVMASNYNSRPRPAEILVEGDRARVVRQRETMEDLIRGES